MHIVGPVGERDVALGTLGKRWRSRSTASQLSNDASPRRSMGLIRPSGFVPDKDKLGAGLYLFGGVGLGGVLCQGFPVASSAACADFALHLEPHLAPLGLNKRFRPRGRRKYLAGDDIEQ